MTVIVKLFALLRDQAGVGQLPLDLNEGATVGAAMDLLRERFPQTSRTLPRTAKAVNLSAADDDTVLSDGDELALLPPVSGG